MVRGQWGGIGSVRFRARIVPVRSRGGMIRVGLVRFGQHPVISEI
uniref:Uncharacterized protein n=1 Tax=Arundo donax TaxID=35708 RepID=A0A0A8ZEI9_ARUDO